MNAYWLPNWAHVELWIVTELFFDELVVIAFLCSQLFMRAHFNDLSTLHHEDSICIHHCWKSMSNNDDCWLVLLVIWRQFLYWILHHALTVRIQGRSGLVEYDNFRLSHESSRDRNPLFLSSAQISSLLSDWTIKPFVESFLVFEKLHASRTFSGIFDIFNAVVIEAVGDIVLDGSRKHSGILID